MAINAWTIAKPLFPKTPYHVHISEVAVMAVCQSLGIPITGETGIVVSTTPHNLDVVVLFDSHREPLEVNVLWGLGRMRAAIKKWWRQKAS